MSDNMQELLNNETVIALIKKAGEMGAKVAIQEYEKNKAKNKKSRSDKRLYNTKLLLQNFRKFKVHTNNAISTSSEYKSHFVKTNVKENIYDILMDIEEEEDDLYIESICRTRERTSIIVSHIEKMIGYYKIYCYDENKPEIIRRYNIIYDMYIDDSVGATDIDKIIKKYSVDRSTAFRDIGKGTADLAPLIFGIDGLKK